MKSKKTKPSNNPAKNNPKLGVTFYPESSAIAPSRNGGNYDNESAAFKVLSDFCMSNWDTFTLRDFVNISGALALEYGVLKFYFDEFTASAEKSGKIKKLPSCDAQIWQVVLPEVIKPV